jgi:GNAT superfamily N-acetyltransferase
MPLMSNVRPCPREPIHCAERTEFAVHSWHWLSVLRRPAHGCGSSSKFRFWHRLAQYQHGGMRRGRSFIWPAVACVARSRAHFRSCTSVCAFTLVVRHRSSSAAPGLTLPSSGHIPAGYARFHMPLMSNVRRQVETVDLHVSEPVSDAALNGLFASAWAGHTERSFQSALSKSLLYVCAYENGRLVGFVNVATDGGQHAFILDTTVHRENRRNGVGKALVRKAIEEASRAGVTWLHVDYEPELHGFYETCGFRPSSAGILRVGA